MSAGSSVARKGLIRGPQSLVSGTALIALALFALYLTRDLPQGTLRSMGPAMLPRWLAIGVGLCGVALVVTAFLKAGEALEPTRCAARRSWSSRFVAFGIAIRGFDLGAVQVPMLGLMIAGPLAIFLSGFASPEARFRELASRRSP